MSAAVKTDDGHSHIQRLAGRDAADVRERVKRNVNVVIIDGMIGGVRSHVNLRGVDAEIFQPPAHEVASACRVENFMLEDQSA